MNVKCLFHHKWFYSQNHAMPFVACRRCGKVAGIVKGLLLIKLLNLKPE